MPGRDLTIGIDGDSHGVEDAFERSTDKAREYDRELARLERQQAAQERVTASAAAAVREYGSTMSRSALAAKKLGDESERAAQKAEKALIRADAAAKAAEEGILDEARAARIAEQAEQALARASLKAAEAHRAQARAADEAADQERQLARDAELAAAAQRLGALKASGAVKEHNKLVTDLRQKYGDLEKVGGEAFQLISKQGNAATKALNSSLSSFAESGPGMIAIVVGALAAVPFAANLAEGAISLGVGGALAGLGLKATYGDKQVQRALGNMTTHVKSETKKIAAPFEQTWLEIAKTGEEAFDKLEPTLKKDFAVLAPAVSKFASDAGVAAQRLAPAFDASSRAADRLLAALGGRLPDITGNLGRAIEIMADSAGKNAGGFADLVTNITALLPPLAHAIDLASRFGGVFSPMYDALTHGALSMDAMHDGLSKLSGGLIKTDDSLHMATGTFPSFSEQATIAAAKSNQLVTAQEAAALAADKLEAAMTDLTGKALGEREALGQYRQAITAMTQSLKDNGHAHGFATQKGAANELALDKVATQAQKVAVTLKAVGKDPAPFLEKARNQIVAMAEQMHYSAAQANILANRLLGITPVKLNVDDTDFMDKLHRAQGLTLDPKTGLLKGDNSDYFNKWLQGHNLKLDPKTGLFRGDNADYYNKWLKANGLKINPKTGVITGNTTKFWAAVHAIPSSVGSRYLDIYQRMHITKTVAYQNQREAISGYRPKATGGPIHRATGGPVQHLAGGGPSGPVVGPGSGTSDDIPVWLSNGEYVVRASQAKKYGGLLEAINQGKNGFASGGVVGYAGGGDVSPLSLSDVLQFWEDAVKPATKKDYDAAVKARKTQINQLKNAEDALYRARKRHDPRAIAAAERRIATEREDVAAATKKLTDVENRYKYAKYSPAKQLDVALALGIKDNASFIKNLQTLADRGAGDLANKLLAMGGAQAEKIAADAVKLNTKGLASLQGKVTQEQAQQNTLAALPNILTVRSALKTSGVTSWVALLNATGLDPASLATAVTLMASDLGKTASGAALIADMHAHGYARGGPIVGPAGTDRVPLWGTAGEYVVRKQPAAENRQLLDAINRGARIPALTIPVRGGDGAAADRPAPQINNTYLTQEMDVHQLANESARLTAWRLRK
ncbi:hypothetical protein [Actinoallomurus iriomotensis]|uniref:Uncharacterized protein n=1 Tax=Actinoallomurus iriomotensis TaxID=478107 RepID=A0A9W6VR50_9ACTN|nr:hypothetical protein [Actinoallomurus iriomotensis]GLY81833.1 hypothetical protein Airi01_101000 [Actinoallomurus iriomotensis]